MNRYRIALAIDLLLLWFRLGGLWFLFLAFATLIAYLNDGFPAWVPPSVGLTALAVALTAALRVLPFWSVSRNGRPVEAQVVDIRKRSHSHGAGSKTATWRLLFRYSIDGKEYEGKSTWTQKGMVERGHKITVYVDPKRPGRAVWEQDLPTQMPPIAFG